MAKRIPVLRNPKYKPNGLKSYGSLLRKYSIAPTLEGPLHDLYSQGQKTQHGQDHHTHVHKHKHGSQGSQPSQTEPTQPQTGSGSGTNIPADDIQNDSQYLVEVSIGTPPQRVLLDFDTGSADLWVWSTELPQNVRNSANSSGHNVFDPTKSSTFKRLSGATWQIQYGDQSSASGDVGTDVLHIGSISIQNQAIELAKVLSREFQSGAGDGLLGLAWGVINTVQPTQVRTPVENMISQSDIPQSAELFTAYLGSYRDVNDPDKGESFYTFGEIDQPTVQANGEPAYTPIDNSQGFWQFESTYVSINGNQIARRGNTAIADTGTTLLLTDDRTLQQIYSAIPGSQYDRTNQGYVFPNNLTASQFPEIIFPCGDTPILVQPEDLAFADAGNGMVYGGIQSRGSLTFDILGDTWLKNAYVVFDQGNKRIGVVQRKNDPQNLAPPPS